MKLRVLIVAVVLIVGLWAANRWLNAPRSSLIDSVPNAMPTDATGKATQVRANFTVGFLPVT